MSAESAPEQNNKFEILWDKWALFEVAQKAFYDVYSTIREKENLNQEDRITDETLAPYKDQLDSAKVEMDARYEEFQSAYKSLNNLT